MECGVTVHRPQSSATQWNDNSTLNHTEWHEETAWAEQHRDRATQQECLGCKSTTTQANRPDITQQRHWHPTSTQSNPPSTKSCTFRQSAALPHKPPATLSTRKAACNQYRYSGSCVQCTQQDIKAASTPKLGVGTQHTGDEHIKAMVHQAGKHY